MGQVYKEKSTTLVSESHTPGDLTL